MDGPQLTLVGQQVEIHQQRLHIGPAQFGIDPLIVGEQRTEAIRLLVFTGASSPMPSPSVTLEATTVRASNVAVPRIAAAISVVFLSPIEMTFRLLPGMTSTRLRISSVPVAVPT